MRSSFASFNTGLLGVRASQYALDITGHNISNINTVGYTRQRTDQYSMALKGGGVNNWDSRIGMGVMVSGISQIRDPYLDVRFRNEVCQVGYVDSTLAGLEDLRSILDEVGLEAGIIEQFNEISKQISSLAKDVTSSDAQNLLRSAMDTLTKFMNQYAKKVELAQAETEKNFQEQDIPQVNDILKQIKDLNVSIETNHANGNEALELMDKRNVLIDQLANYMKIEVNYTPKSIAGTDRKIDQLNIDFVQSDGRKISLIAGQGAAGKFDAKIVNGKMTVSLTPSNPKLDTEALGGYPGLTPGQLDSAVDPLGVNDLLRKIADFNNLTSQAQADIDAKSQTMNTAYEAFQRAKAAAAATPGDAGLQDALTAARDDYNTKRDEWNDAKTVLSNHQKDRKPTLSALQQLLPEARFKEEADGNLTVTYSKNNKNYTLVQGQDTAEFSVAPGTGDDRKGLYLQGVGEADPAQIAKYPAITSDNVSDVNNILKQMQALEKTIQENPPLIPDPANPGSMIPDDARILADRQALQQQLTALMPDANITIAYPDNTAVPPTEYMVKLTQNGTDYLLVNGTTPPAQFKVANNALKVDPANPADPPTDITDLMSSGSLKGTMELLNCDGAFDARTSNPRGYGYYTKMLDTLAISMANAFNDANKMLVDENGNPIHDDKGNVIGGPLFGTNNGEPLTAKNICIAQGWADGDYGVVTSRDYKDGDAIDKGKNENILHIQNLIDSSKTTFLKNPGTIDPDTGLVIPGTGGDPANSNDVAFSGTFMECFKNMTVLLGTDIKTNTAILNNHLSVANDISNNIDSVSSVSLDEEGINMMKYQKSLTAAMRFMTTIDEALNTIINNMGVVGR